MDLVHFSSEYENFTGAKVNPAARRFMGILDEIGNKFHTKGSEDAINGIPVPPDDAFARAGMKICGEIETAKVLAAFLQDCYMDGRNTCPQI